MAILLRATGDPQVTWVNPPIGTLYGTGQSQADVLANVILHCGVALAISEKVLEVLPSSEIIFEKLVTPDFFPPMARKLLISRCDRHTFFYFIAWCPDVFDPWPEHILSWEVSG